MANPLRRDLKKAQYKIINRQKKLQFILTLRAKQEKWKHKVKLICDSNTIATFNLSDAIKACKMFNPVKPHALPFNTQENIPHEPQLLKRYIKLKVTPLNLIAI